MMVYGPAMYGLEPLPDPPPTCSACDGTEHLRMGSHWHDAPICKPCFMVWYDTGETDPATVGRISMQRKADGKHPWTGQYAPASR